MDDFVIRFFDNFIHKQKKGFISIRSLTSSHNKFIIQSLSNFYQKYNFHIPNFNLTQFLQDNKHNRFNLFCKLFNQYPIYYPQYSNYGWKGFQLLNFQNLKPIKSKPDIALLIVYTVVKYNLHGSSLDVVKKYFDKQTKKYSFSHVSLKKFKILIQKYLKIKKNHII